MVLSIAKKLCAAALAACLLLLSACGSAPEAASAQSPAGRVEGPGFDSPEAAALAYLEGMQAADLSRMMSTFAVETYVEHYDLQAYLERTSMYSPYQEIRVPNVDEFFTGVNVERRRATVSNTIASQCTLFGNLDLDPSTPTPLNGEAEVEALLGQMHRGLSAIDFTGLEVLGFLPPAALSEHYEKENNLANLDKQAKAYGADRIVSCVVAFRLDGTGYFLCLEAVEYGGVWYNLQLGGNVAALLSMSIYTYGLGPLNSSYFDLDIESLVIPIDS